MRDAPVAGDGRARSARRLVPPYQLTVMALLRRSAGLIVVALGTSCQPTPASAPPTPAPARAGDGTVVVASSAPRVDSTPKPVPRARQVVDATTPMMRPAGSDVAPTYSPDDERTRLRPVDGYRIELVAAEPLVQDPIAIDFDADGRMYVVEMRGYMPNVKGTGEERPIGRIVVVEDTNHDGVMDRSTVFMDSLVLPRAIKVLEHGVLVAVPPNLWLVRDTTGDLQADTKELIRSDYGDPKTNPEHQANGLHWGIDNWIHNANYPGQFRMGADGRITFRNAPEEGQWGLSSDEYGRIYRNSNEDPLRADLIPSHYAVRNPNLPGARGVYERLTPNVAVWPAHKTPAINRGYRAETMRPDSSLAHYTSAGGPTAYVGDRLPAELRKSVFITESAGNLVGRLIVRESADGMPVARTAYDHREFLTSTDERFRPVNLANAPDGTLYVVDMYRGIVQHRVFITGYLEQKIIERGLDKGIGMGRIWRVVHTSTPRDSTPALSKRTPGQLVPYLADPNGWRRITAQRVLVERGDSSVAPALRGMARSYADDRARLHALWTLDGLHAADRATLETALADGSAAVRAAAVRIAEPLLAQGDTMLSGAVQRLVADRDPGVRRQFAASMGELPLSTRDDALMNVVAHSGDDAVVADLVVGALAGRELAFLERLLASPTRVEARTAPTVRALSLALVTSRDAASVQRVLQLAGEAARPRWVRYGLLAGMRRPTGQRGGFVIDLPAAPVALLAVMASRDAALRSQATAVATALTWPGKKAGAPPVPPLTAAERQRFAAGQQQYLQSCAGCHQVRGTGLAGVAKPLVGSPWVLGLPDRAIRILLHGKEGTMLMPPVGAQMSNDQIAAVLTYVRRSWGNGASAVDAALVKEIRGLTTGRTKPWTDEELQRARQ